ncbi:MAG: ergothioneine biosynthesis protein EgtB [Parasphingorhabdus sp.]
MDHSSLTDRFTEIRNATVALTNGLSDADATVQSMEDASPAKWHLAHTSWFFETFILRDHVDGYSHFRDGYDYLFNSYYEAEGARHTRAARGMITRPSLDEIKRYRAWVDEAMVKAIPAFDEKCRELVTLGLHHEQQHQELLLTDVKHMFAQNPLKPAWFASDDDRHRSSNVPLDWIEGKTGIVEIGHDGNGFAFDCEGPRHQVLLTPHALANRCVTNAEWIEFIEDGGYRKPEYWLSDGWAWVRHEDIQSPLYWEETDQNWRWFTLNGMQHVEPHAPVTHVSLYEADAFATWANKKWDGVRLPTEAEWESAATSVEVKPNDASCHHVRPSGPTFGSESLTQMFGDVWEWTGSAYRPYPAFMPVEGAVGEYNGKFMSGQFVLRGGSCATPERHIRPSYRNFFYPHQRWQFTGLRLAKDI